MSCDIQDEGVTVALLSDQLDLFIHSMAVMTGVADGCIRVFARTAVSTDVV